MQDPKQPTVFISDDPIPDFDRLFEEDEEYPYDDRGEQWEEDF